MHRKIRDRYGSYDDSEEMSDKVFDSYDSYDDSDKLQNKLIAEVIKDDSPFMQSNKLLMFSLFYKRMKLAFLVYLLEAELSKPNEESSKYAINLNINWNN